MLLPPKLASTVLSATTKLYCIAGKGWYNLSESNYETYGFSKLKRLLTMTRFLMEDTIRSLVLENQQRFLAFMQAACSVKVTCRPLFFAC